tara:strand:+ start:549 stop:1403 length:855 start_codon:yes stop_codon:yes gene_type:complete
MKIKLYIVTYKNTTDLNNNLKSLFASDLLGINMEINIINNHSNFNLNEEYKDRVKVLHNVLRPDFSTGHLSRNWNQAIINGFKDLNNPDCDILIHCQDDLLWSKNWLKKLLEIHEKYTFFTGQAGDAICSYTPEAVKHIGLWDERFCSIGYHEMEYFTRAYLYNRNKSTINAGTNKHNILHDIEKYFPYRPTRNEAREQEHVRSSIFHTLNWKLLTDKWFDIRPNIEPKDYWTTFKQVGRKHSKLINYLCYPYFEKDIYGLKEKNYLCVDFSEKAGLKLSGAGR